MLTSLVISHSGIMCPADRTRLHHLSGSLTKESITSAYSREIIRQTHIEGHSPEHLTTTCQGHERQEKTKKTVLNWKRLTRHVD